MLLAAFAFAWMNLFAKYLSDFHPLQVVFFRATGTFIFIFPYMLIKKIPVFGKNRFWLALRGVLSFASVALFFYVIQRIPLGSAVALRYTAPIFSVLLAYFFLKEKVKKWQWIALLVSLAGAFVMKGVDFRIDSLSFVMILASAILVGAVFTIVRYLGSREHFLTIINYFMVVSILGSLVSINHWRLPSSEEWPYVCAIGVLGMIGQIFMTLAFQKADTNTVAPLKYMELVYALLFGFFLFSESYEILPIVGMSLVVAGMLWNVLIKQRG